MKFKNRTRIHAGRILAMLLTVSMILTNFTVMGIADSAAEETTAAVETTSAPQTEASEETAEPTENAQEEAEEAVVNAVAEVSTETGSDRLTAYEYVVTGVTDNNSLESFIDRIVFDGNSFTIYFSEKPESNLYLSLTDEMTCQLPDCIEVQAAIEDGIFYIDTDNGREAIGSYSIDTAGLVSLKIDPALYVEHVGSGRHVEDGFITFSGSYDSSKDEDEKVTDESNGSGGEDEPDPKAPKLIQTKSSEIDWTNGTVTYTISVTAVDGDFVNIQVVDTPSEDLTLAGEIIVKKIDEENEQETEPETYESIDALKAERFELKEGWKLEITYTMKVEAKASPTVDNKVDVTGKVAGKNDVEAEVDADVEGNGTTDDSGKFGQEWVKKRGSVDQDLGNVITWTLEVGKGYASVAGLTVTDTLLPDDVLGYTLEFNKEKPITLRLYHRTDESSYSRIEKISFDWSKLTFSENGKEWQYTIPQDLFGEKYDLNDPSYYISFEYETNIIAENPTKSTKHKNSATVDGKQIGDGPKTDSREVVSGGVNVKKSGRIDDKKRNIVNWEIQITVPADGCESAYLSDTLENDGVNYDTLVTDSLRVNWGDYTPDSDYPEQKYILNPTGNKFYIYFNANGKTASRFLEYKTDYIVTITYQTEINSAIKTGTRLKNHASIGGKTASASVTKPGDLMVTKRVIGNERNMPAQTHQYEVCVYGYFTDNKLVIKDHFEPAGILQLDDLAGVYVRLSTGPENPDEGGDLDEKYLVIDRSKEQQGDITITIMFPEDGTISKIDDYRTACVWLYYSLTVTDEALRTHGNLALDSENYLYAECGDESVKSNTVTGVYKDDVLKKNLEWVQEADDDAGTPKMIQYSLILNKSEADLNPDGDILEIRDTLSQGLSLIEDENGGWKVWPNIDEWPEKADIWSVTYNEETGVIVFTIPDQTYVKITYQVAVDDDVDAVTNTAEVTGIPGATVTKKKEFRQDSSAGGRIGISASEVQVTKVWDDDKTVDHSGHSVGVQLIANYSVGGKEFVEPAGENVNPQITDTVVLSESNGWTANWTGLITSYLMPDYSRAAVTYTVEEIWSSVDGYESSLEVINGKFVLTNKKAKGSLIIEKKLVGAASGTFEFTVTKDGMYYDADGTASVEEVKLSLNYPDETSITVSDLEPGEYTVSEAGSREGYAVSGEGEVTVEGGSTAVKTITNTKLHFRVNKVELGSRAEIAGAELTVYEVLENGKLEKAASWTSAANETHDFGDVLEAGKSYVLRETKVPKGYRAAGDIYFTVEENGSITTTAEVVKDADGNDVYLVEDAKIPEETSRSEEATSTPAETTSPEETSTPEESTVPEETSTPEESTTPEETSTPEETTSPEETSIPEESTVPEETPAPEETTSSAEPEIEIHFEVNKVDDDTYEELAGAILVIIDKETGFVVDRWISVIGETYDFGRSLTAGRTYILRETVAPEYYAAIEDIEFTVRPDGSIDIDLEPIIRPDGSLLYQIEDEELSDRGDGFGDGGGDENFAGRDESTGTDEGNGGNIDDGNGDENFGNKEESDPAAASSTAPTTSPTVILGIEDNAMVIGWILIVMGGMLLMITAAALIRRKKAER